MINDEKEQMLTESYPPASFLFRDDCLSEDEQKKKIDDIIRRRNSYLISLGYEFDNNGNLVPPDTKISDAIIGLAVGDAFGVPVEFRTREELSKFPIKDMLGYGSHHVPAGTWSDDTSMVLATMDSITEKKELDYFDMMSKFYEWNEYAKYTATGVRFDIGRTTKNAILKFSEGASIYNCGCGDIKENGNGSLMRILPIACYLYYGDFSEQEEVNIINDISSLTHAHEISCLGCKIYSDYVKSLLDGNSKFDALEYVKNIDYSKYYSTISIEQYNRILEGNIFDLKSDDIRTTGYVVDSLETCLWSTLTSETYEEALLKVVNLGGDTDTIGAITGGINGLIYGKDMIPERWVNSIQNRNYLESQSKSFEKFVKNINKDLNGMFSDGSNITSSEVVSNGSYK